ncbi:nuclear transport factor 2 family protein [Streptomyces sp. NPDC020490]|uniref:nuclear transport factor 2 family protein n=1 Tax=Streptomyces sp. NPDC020490 TaxID=3365078 RepID=UPI0037A4E672
MTTPNHPGTRESLLDQDQRFFDALVAGDVTVLDELLTDDFLLVSLSDGAVATKFDLLSLVRSGAVTFPAVQPFPAEAVVRFIGDIGITVGRTSMNFTQADGTTFTAGSRYTHVFAFDPAAGWRLHSAQGTQIAAAA